MKPTSDPYRILGILRGADREQVKTAHRRLAKLYHPDGASGDAQRFLAVQEAYQVLSDPLRRREWDRLHAPGPTTGPTRGTSARPPRSPVSRPPDHSKRGRGARGPRQRNDAPTTERVPWWEDYRPGVRRDAAAEPPPGTPPEPPLEPRPRSAEPTAPTPDESDADFDVFSRSSGAAWSSAARRHFRRGTDDLPSRGVWRYRGTQVVTGAEARKVAAEEEEENRTR